MKDLLPRDYWKELERYIGKFKSNNLETGGSCKRNRIAHLEKENKSHLPIYLSHAEQTDCPPTKMLFDIIPI